MMRGDTNLVPWMSELYEEMVFRQPQPQPALYPASNAVIIPNTISAKSAVAVLNFIGAYYVYLFIGLGWAALAAFGFLIWFFRRWRLSEPVVTTLLLLGATIITRLLFFSFLDATWWPEGYERYLVPVMPLTTIFFVLMVYQAFLVRRNRASVET